MIDPAETEILHEPYFQRKRVVVGHNGPALKRVKKFCRVETEGLGIAEVPNHLAFIADTKRVGRVKQQLKIMLARDLLKLFNGTGFSPKIDTDNARRALGDQFFNKLWINRMRDGINIAENRRDLLPLQRMRRRNKCE